MTRRKIDIEKSSRHSKIIGNLGEHLVCNWLSRSGFEMAVVDHTGIDVIAYNPRTCKRLGITVKSRTRNPGKEKTSVNIFRQNKKENDRKRLTEACRAFGCEPWIAIYNETTNYADLFLTSLENYDAKYRENPERKVDTWKMSPRHLELYGKDTRVMYLHLVFEAKNWFNAD
jgi:Holliday junction resolvase-like predicted endonuclease